MARLVNRRDFAKGIGATAAFCSATVRPDLARAKPNYHGPNVIIIRFGGGVRRRETIAPKTTFAPFFTHSLIKRGVLIPDLMIEKLEGQNTSHAEGTLNILTGRYLAWQDAGSRIFDDRLEPTEPTLFEYFRKTYAVPAHQTLLINGEDRPQEEFFAFARHKHYGIKYRSENLSLYRYKLYKLKRFLRSNKGTNEDIANARREYKKLKAMDYRGVTGLNDPMLNRFWESWRRDYRDSGLLNPRGDRLLTELALRAMKNLKPRLMMINYQDPDYVHWGNKSHYTRAISIIDQGLESIIGLADRDPFYRRRTNIIIVPDCGRDANPLTALPYQHHFNTRSAHEIWAFAMGPHIAKGKIYDRRYDQSQLAATVGAMMGMPTPRVEGAAIGGLFT